MLLFIHLTQIYHYPVILMFIIYSVAGVTFHGCFFYEQQKPPSFSTLLLAESSL